MYKYALCLCCSLLWLWATQAQTKVIVKGAPAGVYLSIQQPLPYTTGYKVFRREAAKGDYMPVGSFAPCVNKAMLHQRMTAFTAVLPDYVPPGVALTDTLWSMYRGAQKERIAAAAFPLLHLALGLAFIDTTAVEGVSYQYNLQFTDSVKPAETEMFLFRPFVPEYAAMQLLQSHPDAHILLAEWATTTANAAPFFDVYRRHTGITAFEKVPAERSVRSGTREDSLIFRVADSSILPGITYEYFLVAKDYLGNNGNHSDTVRLQAGGRSNVPAVFNLSTGSDSNGIRLSWRMPEGAPALRNIIVLRSETYDTGYKPLVLLPVTDSAYTDRAVKGGRNYYYQLITEGAFNYSIPTPRVSGMYTGAVTLLPPQKPELLRMKKGVALSWRYAEREDISGFKVYRSASPRLQMQLLGAMVPVNNDSATYHFMDTTAGNTTYYYAVTAVSRTSSQSPFSEVANLSAEIRFAVPAPDGLRFLLLNDSTVSVTWRDLHHDVQGVAAYRIYRLPVEQEHPGEQYIFRETAENECMDTLSPGITRWYAVQTIDIEGKGSGLSRMIRVEAPIQKPLPPASIRMMRTAKGMVLTWNATADERIRSYQVYRSEATGKPVLLKTIASAPERLSFVDETVGPDKIYFYYITAVDRKGIESDRSEEISFRQ